MIWNTNYWRKNYARLRINKRKQMIEEAMESGLTEDEAERQLEDLN